MPVAEKDLRVRVLVVAEMDFRRELQKGEGIVCCSKSVISTPEPPFIVVF